jgi:hypothetical protein
LSLTGLFHFCAIKPKADGGLNKGPMGIGKSAVVTNDRTPTLAEAGIDKTPPQSGGVSPTLADAGISHNLSARAQKTCRRAGS